MADTSITDSEKLHFAEQKDRCDKEYYANLVTQGFAKTVFWILGLFFLLIGASFGYTKLVSTEVVIVDKIATVNSDRYQRILEDLKYIKDSLPERTRE